MLSQRDLGIVRRDLTLSGSSVALDARTMESMFQESAISFETSGSRKVRAIEVLKHKPGRRCLIAYKFAKWHTVLGKVRFKGLDRNSYGIQTQLFENGFNDRSPDSISVPATLGAIPHLNIWFQQFVPGNLLIDVIRTQDNACSLAPKLVAALTKLNSAAVRVNRIHTVCDEVSILNRGLATFAIARPDLSDRIDLLTRKCQDLAGSVSDAPLCLIHRDFFHDQVIIDDSRIWLLDFDLCCLGPRALDAGNFIGHLIELSIREPRHADRIEEFITAFRKACRESCLDDSAAIEAFTRLTLARHVYLSSTYPDRGVFTETILNRVLHASS